MGPSFKKKSCLKKKFIDPVNSVQNPLKTLSFQRYPNAH